MNFGAERWTFFVLFFLAYGAGLYLTIDQSLVRFVYGVLFSEISVDNSALTSVEVAQYRSNLIIFSITLSGSIVFLYAFSILIVFRDHLDVQAIVDSPYFLGFMFTLTSLSYAFYESATQPGAIPFNFINQAGIALITSIVGLACRLVLSMYDPELSQRRISASSERREPGPIFSFLEYFINLILNGIIGPTIYLLYFLLFYIPIFVIGSAFYIAILYPVLATIGWIGKRTGSIRLTAYSMRKDREFKDKVLGLFDDPTKPSS